MFESLRGLVGRKGESRKNQHWPSVVILLSAAKEYSDAELEDLAVKTWGGLGDKVEIAGKTEAGSRVLRVATFFFAVHHFAGRYEAEGRETSESQQKSWDEHRAAISIDYPQGTQLERSKWPDCYRLLLLFANHIWDEKCLGLYFPAEGVTLPNMGNIVASIRWGSQHGIDLGFLRKEKPTVSRKSI